MKNIKFVKKSIAAAVASGMVLITGSATDKKGENYKSDTLIVKCFDEENQSTIPLSEEQRIEKEVLEVLDKLNIQDNEEYVRNYQNLYYYKWMEKYNNSVEKTYTR